MIFSIIFKTCERDGIDWNLTCLLEIYNWSVLKTYFHILFGEGIELRLHFWIKINVSVP